MSNTDIRVVPGPANYFSHPGSLARLNDFFTPEQLSRAVWIYGERAIDGARPFLPESFHAPGAKRLLFKGHCSERDVTHLVDESGSDASVVIGVGGGAVQDAVKAVARRLGVPFVGIPPLPPPARRGRHSPSGTTMPVRRCSFEIFDDANFLVLVEPQIVLNAPAEYLLAGIGDTLAKWYEAVVLAPEPENLPLTVRLGLNGALAIRDVLLEHSEEALADQQRGEQTQAFRDVVDAIIAGGGMVGGLGERYTRVAAAHAVHNGLTVLPQTEKYLHGTKVAYGILVQSALLGQDDVLAQLVAAYRRFNLPTTLRALDVDIHNRDELDKVIAHTLRPVDVNSLSAGDVNARRSARRV